VNAPAGRAGRAWHAIVDHYRKPRVLGLDLLRITASLTIVVYHGNAIGALGRNGASSIIHADGYLAVDIFFVLSGWLLTRQVLRMRGSFASLRSFASTFWIRRWARIIPAYWVVLMILFLFGSRANRFALPHELTVSGLIKHAFFLQTLFPPNQYGVTWSLVTEEWFYLLLPLVVVLLVWMRRPWVLLALGAGALLLSTLVRALMLERTGDWGYVSLQPQARFEGLVIGALLAAASLAPWWETHVVRRRRWLFALGAPAAALLLIAGVHESWRFYIFGILAFNLAVGLLLPFLSQLRWSTQAPVLAVMATAYLSELTYPLYLLHPIVPRIPWVQQHGLLRLLPAVSSLALLLLAASALHLGVERPFLHWRDRRATRQRDQRQAAAWKEPAEPLAPVVDERHELPPQVATQPA
jgi:peptidoglycan/LPS O-acetylase OafA/YrhL